MIIIELLFGSQDNLTLACGLFAFIGIVPEGNFHWDKFNILGWFNDSRGGDACGRVVGDIYEHGTDSLKTYKEFAMKVKNPKIDISYNTILGHCRKASSGGKDNIYAQPIVLLKKDINIKAIKNATLKNRIRKLEDNDIIFSGIHNGTIENYKELAPTYGIPLEDHNDTKVLLTALFYEEYDILTKYIGTAALIWQNHLTEKTFIFKGESKGWNTSINTSEERPLFFWEVSDSNYYISSIKDSLLFIGATEKEVGTIRTNTLFTYKKGKLLSTRDFDRSKCFQNETYTTSSSNRRGNIYWRHNDFAYEQNTVLRNFGHRQDLPALRHNINDVIDEANRTANIENLKQYLRVFNHVEEPYRLQSEINKGYIGGVLRSTVYNKGRYWMNGALMHGIYILNSIGIIPSKATRDSQLLKLYYFIEGVMLRDVHAYDRGMEIYNAFMLNALESSTDIYEAEQKFTEDILVESEYPLCSLTNVSGLQDIQTNIKINISSNNRYYNGSFSPIFSDRTYVCQNGDLINIIEGTKSRFSAIHTLYDSDDCETYINRCRSSVKGDDISRVGYRLLILENQINELSPYQHLLFSMTGIEDNVNSKLLIVNHLRDNNTNMRNMCTLCTHEDTNILSTCSDCKILEGEFKKLLTTVNYDEFKSV